MPPDTSSSGAAACPVAQAPSYWLRAIPEPPRVLWIKLLPPGWGKLWSRHVSCDTSSRLLAQGSSRTTTYPIELYGL
jgi:hypothetical protein